MSGFLIPYVIGELVSDVSKILANSGKPLTLKDLSKSFEGQYTSEYVRRSAI